METKYDINQTVLVKGIVKTIEIMAGGKVIYKVQIKEDTLQGTTTIWIKEDSLLEESKNE